MSDKSLTNEDIRKHIGLWMSELFDKNVLADDVKNAITKVIEKIVILKLRNEMVDIEKLHTIFKEIKL